MTDEQLNGNEVSWKNFGKMCYVTNFGQVYMSSSGKILLECCIELGKNQGNTRMGIKILDKEFQISRDAFGMVYSELCSKNYPHPQGCKQSIKIAEVLSMLKNDDNDSTAAVIVKRQIIKLMYKKLKFKEPELIALQELFESWRKPIITRTPIRR